MGVSTVSVRFRRRQQSATASIKIASDDIVEQTESFKVKLTLPKKEIRKKKLKYGSHQQATVYIQDSELLHTAEYLCM